MDKLKFAQAATRLRVLETRLLDRNKLDRMIDSATSEGALKILLDNNYTGISTNNPRPEDFELLLTEELEKLYALMYEISPEKLLIDILSVRYDYHNIKVLLKAKALQKDLDYLLISVGTVDTKLLKEAIETEEYDSLPPLMQEAIVDAEEVFSRDEDPQQIDMVLDRCLYKDMMEKAKLLDDIFVIGYLKTLIDFMNIKTFIRIKKQNKELPFLYKGLIEDGKIEREVFYSLFSDPIESLYKELMRTEYEDTLKEGFEDYFKTKKSNVLERRMENYLMELSKVGKYITFGVEPLFSFALAKETEIKNARIVMVGKMNNITPKGIRERMRDIYV